MIFGASYLPLVVAFTRAVEPLVYAATGGDPASSILDFAKYGLLGLVLLAIIGGWLWAKPAVEQLKADKASAEARADKMQQTVELAVPALADAASVLKDVKPLILDAREQGRRIETLLSQVQVLLQPRPGAAT